MIQKAKSSELNIKPHFFKLSYLPHYSLSTMHDQKNEVKESAKLVQIPEKVKKRASNVSGRRRSYQRNRNAQNNAGETGRQLDGFNNRNGIPGPDRVKIVGC